MAIGNQSQAIATCTCPACNKTAFVKEQRKNKNMIFVTCPYCTAQMTFKNESNAQRFLRTKTQPIDDIENVNIEKTLKTPTVIKEKHEETREEKAEKTSIKPINTFLGF